MSMSIAGRITLNLVAGILVTVVTVVAAVIWMAEAQNEQAQVSTRTMVTGGIVAMEDNVKAFANDYGWWEAGYNAYMAHDEAWVDANFGSGIRDTQISDILVIISTEGRDRDRDRGLGLGANAYLVKPFAPEALLDLIRRFLPQHGS